MPNNDDIWEDRSWKNYYKRTDKTPNSPYINTFLSHIPQNGLILDFGCGNARWSKVFIKKRPDITIDLLDRCLHEVDNLPKNNIGEKYPISFQEFNYPLEKYDGIWAHVSLFFLPSVNDITEHFKKLFNSLAHKGILFTTFVDNCEEASSLNFIGVSSDVIHEIISNISNCEIILSETIVKPFGEDRIEIPTHHFIVQKN